MIDVGELARVVTPYVSATLSAYGKQVIEKVTDESADASADATVSVGRRVLLRLLGSSRAPQVTEAITDAAGDTGDEDLAATVRVQLRKALAEDPDLAAQLAALLTQAGVDSRRFDVAINGSQGVQVGDHNTQTNTFGPLR